MADEDLCQALHDKFTRTDLLLLSRSCGLQLKGNPTKLIFASEILRDMRAFYAARAHMSGTYVREELETRYEKAFRVLWSIRVRPKSDINEYMRQRRMNDRRAELDSLRSSDDAISLAWPIEIPNQVNIDSCSDYFTASQWRQPRTCACCVRAPRNVPFVTVHDVRYPAVDWNILRLTDEFLLSRCASDFVFDTFRPLDGIMLDHSLITFDENNGPLIPLCAPCLDSLKAEKVPKFSLKNDNYRGRLPADLGDLTWLEERVCALYCTTAYVTRLFQKETTSDLQSLPFMLYGSSCAFEMNTVSTACVLPRTPSDVNGNLAIICVGPGKVTKKDLQSVFHVRKAKVMAFLHFLKANHCDYAHVTISDQNAALYEEDAMPDGLFERVTHDRRGNAARIFREEAAGLEDHPAEAFLSKDRRPESADAFIETMGVIDPDGTHIAGRMYTAAALRNLYRKSGDANFVTGDSVPLVLARSNKPANEYHNPQLFPGLFPTLFPLGRGGFESTLRDEPIAFQTQAAYFFDLADRNFCRHSIYPFVAVNQIQHRAQHLNTYFTVRKSNFDSVAKDLASIDSNLIASVADHLEREKSTSGLSDEQKKVFGLLSKVNTIASKVPGSEAAKIHARNHAYAMSGYFGISDSFLTINCDPMHAPLFQVMFGDTSVDLSERYPSMPSSETRARRIAADPVAAADFFEFCIRLFFEHLLGWDFAAAHSSSRGGVLGHLRAFFGTVESTKRMRLHGHFLLWLKGSLNPKELHRRLESDDVFKARYFRFWDSVIHHHLPDFEYELPVDVHPGTQRPPMPGCRDWDAIFLNDVKLCGEKFQRHGLKCKPVCHSYGNDGRCRFGFPHDVVEESHYDAEKKSVVMRCLDPWVNYFNPHILVMTRHNHDLKTIQSGRAAKGAIYYTTDYMTKGDLRTYEALTLMSRAVSIIPRSDSESDFDRAKRILHKCVSKFEREQQISGQVAARYIRGLSDSMASHKTVPMLSSGILARVKRELSAGSLDTVPEGPQAPKKTGSSTQEDVNNNVSDDEDEYEPVRVSMTDEGCCAGVTQIDDYWCRDERLACIVFYSFVQCFKKEKKPAKASSPEKTRLGTRRRFDLRAPHVQHKTHDLVQCIDPEHLIVGEEVIPRPVGCTIPRPGSTTYAFFMMCHFAPCGLGQALPSPEDAPVIFAEYPFSAEQRRVMDNWEALNECEDERDADRLRKRMTKSKGSKVLSALLQQGLDDLDGNVVDLNALTNTGTQSAAARARDAKSADVLRQLTQAGYFTTVMRDPPSSLVGHAVANIPRLTMTKLKEWDQSITAQESAAMQRRRTALDPTIQVASLGIKATIQLDETMPIHDGEIRDATIPATVPLDIGAGPAETAENLINRISFEMSLNERQDIAFRIAADYFVTVHAHKVLGMPLLSTFKPLRMFLTGPGGTGKTWVVRALKLVMVAYGCGHRIRALAPTGSAAALIDGMTIHKGLGITIQKKQNGKGNRDVGESKQDYSLVMTPKKAQELRAEWKDVLITVLDEISMVSSETMCDVDQGLQYALEVRSWFADLGVIVAGDSFQLPPVAGTALYMPITSCLQKSKHEIKRRLGRMAYKTIDTVVELCEQQRMKGDPAYGDAVKRLRKRECTTEDAYLFNSRVVASAVRPDGIDMSKPANSAAVAIVGTNLLRETINSRKALSETDSEDSPALILSAAYDTTDGKLIQGPLRETLLRMNANGIGDGALPGLIPFFEGMPVILRSRNISTELKITNGGQGIVRKIDYSADKSGHTTVHCLIIEFPLSTVELPDLPRGWFPVRPVKWGFTVNASDHDADGLRIGKIKVSRSQIPVQPAFAVTGHSAQGKTLPAILLDMRGGGFHAYVGASRPMSRDSLFLTHSITIDDLNVPLPYHLAVEDWRLTALAHNTLVKYGFLSAPLVEVPDPEGEDERLFTHNVPIVQWPSKAEPASPIKKKRKCEDDVPLPDSKIAKLTAKDAARSRLSDLLLPTLSFQGSQWDSTNYSCAYDVFFTAFVSVFFLSDLGWRRALSTDGSLSAFLAECLQRLENQVAMSDDPGPLYSLARDELRDAVSAAWPESFVRYGHVFASADILIEKLRCDRPLPKVLAKFSCRSCGGLNLSSDAFGSYLTEESWSRHAGILRLDENAQSASLDTWLRVMMSSRPPFQPCACGASRENWSAVGSSVLSTDPPLWMSFNCHDRYRRASPLPSHSLLIPLANDRGHARYRLKSIIYLGSGHYTSRLFLDDGTVWKYDGQILNGQPVFEMLLLPGSEFPRHRFTSLGDRIMTDILYTRILDGMPSYPVSRLLDSIADFVMYFRVAHFGRPPSPAQRQSPSSAPLD